GKGCVLACRRWFYRTSIEPPREGRPHLCAIRCARCRRPKRPKVIDGLLLALQGVPETPLNPWEQALWMLLADFLAAAVPILPFVFFPIFQARIVSGGVTVALLIGLGFGRAQIGKLSTIRTVIETVSIGVAAALAGVLIGVLVDRLFAG